MNRTVIKTLDYLEVQLAGLSLSSGPDQQHLPEEREIPGPVPDSLNLISGVDTRNCHFCINDSGAREDLITICLVLG